MRISVCYIVKNEAANLTRSLSTVKECADELIVADTGSEDDSKGIAARAGAKVLDFAWRDDFAAAKNFALDAATGDWVIFLDADEGFLHPSSVRAAVEELDAVCPPLDAVMVELVEIDVDDGGREIGRDRLLRIFRRLPELRYQGRIHENIARMGGSLRLGFADDRLSLYHTGYSSSIIRGKVERNLRLLRQDIAVHGEGPQHYPGLSDCYFGLADYRSALRYALLALDSPLRMVAARSDSFHTAIESMRQLDWDLSEMLALAELAVEEFPKKPEFYGERGMILCGMGRLAEARASLKRAAALYEHPEDDGREAGYYTPRTASIVYARLGELAALAGDGEEAEAYFQEALTVDPSNGAAQKKYEKFCREGTVMKEKGKPRIAGCYIVRNEAEVLGRSLESIEGQVDELVVVDTGSDDDTVKIAKAHGARVILHPWREDFAEARNFALDALTADWVVFLDADEFFTPETKGHLRAEIQAADAAGTDLLLVVWRNIDADTGAHLVDVYTPRIFRRKPSLRYEGRIHEQLREEGEEVKRLDIVSEDRLLLIHTGYSSHLSKAKAERNLRLLLMDLAESRHPEALYMAIAEAYDGLDDDAMAMKYAYMDIANGRQSATYASRSYRLLLRRLARRPAAFAERLDVARRASVDFPELPEFHAEYAECLAYGFDYAGAMREAEAALSTFADYHSIEPLQFDAAMGAAVKERRVLWEKIAARAEALTISACLIARDEAANMPAWLDNTAVYSDERIVADTGSVDGTRERAASAGAKVYDFPWCDDFAAARNFAIAQATGDWVAFLDADETFTAPERVRPLLAEVELLHPEAEAVQVVISNVDEEDGGGEFHRFMAVRLFKRQAALSYRGRVHETLVGEGGRSPVLYEEKYRLLVRHTGYAAKRVAEKARRNLALLEADIEAHGEGPQHDRFLADCFASLGRPAEALRYARRAIAAPLQAVGSQSDMYFLVLQCLRWLDRPLEERLQAAEEARRRFPLLPEYQAEVGALLLEMGEVAEARTRLERALALYRQPEDTSGEASRFAGSVAWMYEKLAELDFQEGKGEMAEEHVEMALRHHPYDEAALNLYAEIRREDSAAAIAAGLRQFFGDGEGDLRYLLRWAEGNGWIRLYQQFSAQLQAEFQKTAPRLALYEKAQQGDLTSVYHDVVTGLAETFPQLVTSLLHLEKEEGVEAMELRRRCAGLLPPRAAEVWAAYEGHEVEYQEDGFRVMLPIFLQEGDDDQIARFGALAAGFSPEALYDVAKKVMGEERWAPAFTLFSRIPGDAAVVTATFWTEVGVCLYHLKEWESAEECFAQAEAMGGETPEIASYRTWMKEAAARA
ncbi:MAG: glycosyltransferase [Schwartzia sp. (in: firmicutes)]